ncbi:hypothetical protein D3C85_974980 [compost metagenome]
MADYVSLDGVNVLLAIKTDFTGAKPDDGYVPVTNEMEVKINTKVKTTEYEMKKNGGETVNKKGAKGVEIKCELAHDEDDEAFEHLADTQGDTAEWQVWHKTGEDVGGDPIYKVKMEGKGIVSELDETAAASGLVTESMTILGAGKFKRYKTPRARDLTTGG